MQNGYLRYQELVVCRTWGCDMDCLGMCGTLIVWVWVCVVDYLVWV